MSMNAGLHRANKVKAMKSNGAEWLHIENAQGDYVSVFMPYSVAAAMQDAWILAGKGEAAAHRARQMNAELPAADRATLEAKGAV